MTDQIRETGKSHMPKDNFLFEKIIPITLVLLGVISLGLIVFAMSLLFGIVHF